MCAHTSAEHALLSRQAVKYNRGRKCAVPALTETAVGSQGATQAERAVPLCCVPLPTSKRLRVAVLGSF